jgi:hypothetical protein
MNETHISNHQWHSLFTSTNRRKLLVPTQNGRYDRHRRLILPTHAFYYLSDWLAWRDRIHAVPTWKTRINTLGRGHEESHFRTAPPLLKYSICSYILMVPSSLSSYFRSFMAPIKLTNCEFLLSLRPRKHKLSQKWSSPCVKILSAFLYIVHACMHLFTPKFVNNKLVQPIQQQQTFKSLFTMIPFEIL